MTQTADLIYKMAEFFRSEEFFEKGEDARLELSPDDVRCMNRIIKACRKPQEPKAVLYSGDGYADGCMVYDMAECPNCGYEYEDGDKDWGLSFCPNCGQKLNWESEE